VLPDATSVNTIDLLQEPEPIIVVDVSVSLFTLVSVNLAAEPQDSPVQ
jgi:hypothetical protein